MPGVSTAFWGEQLYAFFMMSGTYELGWGQ